MVATQKFEKDDILMDYHGKTEHPPNNISFFDFYKEYVKRTDVVQEYVLEVKGINGISTRRLVDATQDKCTKKYHASKRCPGRLTNHTNAENTADDANMKIDEIQVYTTTETHVVFKARRAIEPFERLRWNYKDPLADTVFDQDTRTPSRSQQLEGLDNSQQILNRSTSSVSPSPHETSSCSQPSQPRLSL